MRVLLDWQDGVALAITAAAALFLARRLAGAFRRRADGCAQGCSACPSHRATPGAPLDASQDLVQIGPTPSDRSRPDHSRGTG